MTNAEISAAQHSLDRPRNQALTIVHAIDLTRQGRKLEWGVVGSDEEGSDLVAHIENDSDKQLVEITQTDTIDSVALTTHALHRWLQISYSDQDVTTSGI